MPKRKDLKKILIIGSGPIIIGQAAEFDYSGTQGILALKELNYEVVLVNPNPATIMTDKEIAHKVYMEPLTERFLKYIISKEKPQGILPTLGGQTALNLVIKLSKQKILEKYNVEVLGTNIDSIIAAEDRQKFKKRMQELKIPTPPSKIVNSVEEGKTFALKIKLPVIIRPSYTLGGTGGGIACNLQELKVILKRGLASSPISEVLVEKSIAGYKEIEYEVMRDQNDTSIVVCNMENIDPVGVHTGDSIVVAPSLTLTNKQYQMLRDVSIRIIRDFNIVGGCNVQLALDPDSDKYYVIEINPRVSRSSALASKATGYPIAKISAQIAIGLWLSEIINPITKKTYASFEPTIDYIVTKLPRFPFDKFHTSKKTLSTFMQATGETMSIGRSFEESFLKSVRSLSQNNSFVDNDLFIKWPKERLLKEIATPNSNRLWQIFEAFAKNCSVDEIFSKTKINKYFLNKFLSIYKTMEKLKKSELSKEIILEAKGKGFPDEYLCTLFNLSEEAFYNWRHENGIKPSFKMIDTIANEFESKTNYLYSTYKSIDNESKVSKCKKIVIVGSGPIRIGQGVEFDYATVCSILALKKQNYETIIINNNPETVSTDFSMSDKLYFEPIETEIINEIVDHEKPEGVILQFGGQSAINVAKSLNERKINILGTSFASIDLAENRDSFEKLLRKNEILQPKSQASSSLKEIPEIASRIGYPVLIRPSYVIGGQGMQIVNNENDLQKFLNLNSIDYQNNMILVDKYLPGKEIEVDLVCDGQDIFIPGIIEHIEKSGIHSGDSTTVFPTFKVKPEIKQKILEISKKLALKLKIIGLMNIQFILYENKVYVLEVNTRSSRTNPFISKATQINIVDLAIKVILGYKLKDLGFVDLNDESKYHKYFVKSPVFSFNKLHLVTDIALGPEMKSTGESIGIDPNLNKALYKSLLGANFDCLKHAKVLITVNDNDKKEALEIAKILKSVDIDIFATQKTHAFFKEHNLESTSLSKNNKANSIMNFLKTEKVSYVVNTPGNLVKSISDAKSIRKLALKNNITVISSIKLAKQIAKLTENMKFLIETSYKK